MEAPSQEPPTSAPPATPPSDADPSTAPDVSGSPKPTTLPPQIREMVDEIIASLRTFPTHPPHTIQRIAELVLEPDRHYRAVASYLHALDRVVRVTSPSNRYPLPLPIVSFANGAADQVSWANTTQANLGTDEALGGALLTPIPWLSRQSEDSPSDQSSQSRAELRTESTETIDGPNGMGSIETVSISVNGIPSAGAGGTLRGITQGELLRQEQRAGVIPTNQLLADRESTGAEDETINDAPDDDDDDESPHVRGPDEIGASDLGPTILTINRIDEASLHPQEIDVEAAVGRKMIPEPRDNSPDSDDDVSDSGSKRGAEEDPEGALIAKKPRSDSGDSGEAMEGVEETSEPEKP